jgi:hypothetical protein
MDKKLIFVWIAVGLLGVSLALVFLGKITFEYFLASAGGIILIVTNLWQFYAGKEKDERIKNLEKANEKLNSTR